MNSYNYSFPRVLGTKDMRIRSVPIEQVTINKEFCKDFYMLLMWMDIEIKSNNKK